MKELFINAHEELIEQYLLDHHESDWSEAYDKTSDAAYDRYREKFADMIDDARMRDKERRENG